MSAWKEFERTVAALFGGSRFWANSGEKLDFEAPGYIGQCKLVKNLSLNALSELAEQAERDGKVRQKIGVVAVKCRRGSGRASPMLIVLTESQWRELNGEAKP
jgi:hypothetical protein